VSQLAQRLGTPALEVDHLLILLKPIGPPNFSTRLTFQSGDWLNFDQQSEPRISADSVEFGDHRVL